MSLAFTQVCFSMVIYPHKWERAFPGAGFFVDTLDFGESPFIIAEKGARFDVKWLWVEGKENEMKAKEMAVKVDAEFNSWFASGGVSSEKSSKKKAQRHKHSFVGIFYLDANAAGMDASMMVLSDHAKNIINKGGIVAFEQAFGTAYVQAVSRWGMFVANFEYESETQQRNSDFEIALKAKVGFFGIGGSVSTEYSQSSEHKTENSSLKISFRAYGLKSGEIGFNLAPTNEEELRKTISEASKHLTENGAGHAYSAKLNLWRNHPAVQSALQDYYHDKTSMLDEANKKKLITNANDKDTTIEDNNNQKKQLMGQQFLDEESQRFINKIERAAGILEFQLSAASSLRKLAQNWKRRGTEEILIEKGKKNEIMKLDDLEKNLIDLAEEKRTKLEDAKKAKEEFYRDKKSTKEGQVQNILTDCDLVLPYEYSFALAALKSQY